MQQIVLASGNKGKLTEFDQMLAQFDIEVLPQNQFNVPEVAETGTTFIENAIIKARHAAEITGKAAIADDSGLEVDALQGAPGIYSARYGGEGASEQDNYLKLLAALANKTQRKARFQCVLVYMRHAKDPTPIVCQAAWEGTIGLSPQGEQGHGYDPIFIPQGFDISAAELSSEQKNQLSHRGLALTLLVDAMKAKGIIK
ncbi:MULTISPECIES: RdgB/HAM1 family non-canonical purine NTP pyrophosphatase [unclassified Shewanella]|uniref:RdgB/HAM1 family non-canonical purine NTP pyrophosphatase n=1 Tax=unclassified Shewanella TaxID=196818 RepID=UPI000C845B65|nr:MULTISPECIES: RdgB/HAM1 family non-canonical purine NTP pyrophosphatase [unclassified Shewanella]MDO6680338.1 RdgB/HAM1 family non-canonical purine NTP pyrophosphatase [Shewanella sp. 4_MG-2023]PMG31483.1 non-canonical purine NTP pyrophosphatase, RdgB/HAM1 family [Shewanella sp. 10N.286.52.C2]PMG40608.1 non-canonical purine NTP pyrophosphatase, RdgB/HAM1 family [Shewanella sp. 10N.286.52.B9]PMH84368.1 non-canonical purine NTP pyrophosphatase, RdgB/HAM1 family [Shewanella sp. 10N.286.48.B5]P